MLAAFNTNIDRAESAFHGHRHSGSIQATVGAKPNPPTARHRRGLSLDQGIARNRLKFPSDRYESLEPLQWQAFPRNLAEETLLDRPNTPVTQIDPDSLPLTPATTPSWKPIHIPRACKTAQSSPVKQHAAITRNFAVMERARSSQGVSGSLLPRETLAPLPNTNSHQPLEAFDLQMPKMSDDVFSEFTFHPQENFETTSMSSPISPSMPSFLSLSGVLNERDVSSTTSILNKPAKLPIAPATPLRPASQRGAISSRSSSPSKTLLSPRALSIADLNLDASIDASIEETGITLDDIAAYIDGPDLTDNKWICKYEGCNKRFGRKENIKSHVQTHLGDRQFKCNHCNKCFVRGHDLKRHSKIHTGVKPYPCECGE
ncbi:predicted protein [Uncinocarpus reesii 1704]|uniref:C2H2 type master regulator of conidiophore development brlA n=1 Tax=Uncinocarpus reesii (strain UAMH 1704) TaxID=336963 RepID=C4JZ65_UNCRE|nr:uncharacterized protein UREG_07466 [Uncinocarpus reesii 1704]EEP82601.1 predicted protein [Uncinocarpus reesii 1704]